MKEVTETSEAVYGFERRDGLLEQRLRTGSLKYVALRHMKDLKGVPEIMHNFEIFFFTLSQLLVFGSLKFLRLSLIIDWVLWG